jgi:hypothetical protein
MRIGVAISAGSKTARKLHTFFGSRAFLFIAHIAGLLLPTASIGACRGRPKSIGKRGEVGNAVGNGVSTTGTTVDEGKSQAAQGANGVAI